MLPIRVKQSVRKTNFVYPLKKQKILQAKTIKVDEEIVELTKQLELVEKDHRIQLEANNTQLERLGKA